MLAINYLPLVRGYTPLRKVEVFKIKVLRYPTGGEVKPAGEAVKVTEAMSQLSSPSS